MGKIKKSKTAVEPISPRLALALIANALDGKEWNPDTLMEVCGIIERAGYLIREPGEF